MARPKFVLLPSHPPEAFAPLLGEAEYARVDAAGRRAREQFEGRAIWHLSSTLRGGGVAEMLRSLELYRQLTGKPLADAEEAVPAAAVAEAPAAEPPPVSAPPVPGTADATVTPLDTARKPSRP